MDALAYKSATKQSFSGILTVISGSFLGGILHIFLISNLIVWPLILFSAEQSEPGLFVEILSAFVLGFFEAVHIAEITIYPLIIFQLIISVGWFVYLLGLRKLGSVLDNMEDVKGVKKIRIATIINIVINISMIFIYYVLYYAVKNMNYDMIVWVGSFVLYSGVILVIPIILNILGFKKLKDSKTFPCAEGANKIYISQIFYIIGTFFTIFPYVNIVAWIVNILAFILYIVGWLKIKKSAV